MYPILFLELFINVNLIVPPLKISLNHWGCFCLMRACEGIIYNKSCGRWLIFLLLVFFFIHNTLALNKYFFNCNSDILEIEVVQSKSIDFLPITSSYRILLQLKKYYYQREPASLGLRRNSGSHRTKYCWP
jgi:hypothetical protein